MPMDTLQGVTAAATSNILHPPSPSSSSDVQAAQDEIEEVKKIMYWEEKINGLEEAIEEAKKWGDKEEAMLLRATEQQLREKILQLGEKDLLLLLRANTRNGT